jgi:hypothetical protein
VDVDGELLLGRFWNSSQDQDRTSPDSVVSLNSHSAVVILGVGPAESTGKLR